MVQRWTDKWTLRAKVTVAVALVSLVALAGVAVNGITQMRALAAVQDQQTAQAITQGLASAAELALAVGDEVELARLATRFMENRQISIIAMYDASGKLAVRRARTQEIWDGYLHGHRDSSMVFFDQGVFLTAADNEFSAAAEGRAEQTLARPTPTMVGRVVVGLSKAPALAALERHAESIWVITLGAAGTSAGLVFLLLGTWTRRLMELVKASARISAGDLEREIMTDRHDEIGRLSSAYEDMRLAVKQRDADLRRFNDTLQQQVAERTRALEEAFHTTEVILRHVPVGIMLIGADKRIRRVNDTALAMTGARTAEEIIGKPCHRQTCTALEGKCPVWDCGQTVDHAERTLLRKDGNRIPILKTAVPIVVNGEKLLLEAFVDITAQKQAEATLTAAKEAAEAADRAKSRFLATMSHEIRTPLNGVVGTIDLLRQTHLDENQRRYTQIAKSSAEALLTVINDILDFSKIEAGRMELDADVFALNETVEDVTRMAALVGARKGLEFGCIVESNVPEYVTGDSGRLRQILTNLLNNAVKFTEAGHVLVRVSLVERAAGSALVRFAVTDTGIGIPADRVDRLFQSFSQVDSSTTRKYGGTGLGLAISKRLAELMGGTVGVESAPGQGSTFWFTARVAEAAEVQSRTSAVPRDLRRLRVLAVDDNAVNCEILQQQLSLWYLDAVTASNGAQALKMMQEDAARGAPFDVAILDWHMPGMDGLELAQAIRGCDALQGVALIMLTSIEDRICATELRKLGFAGYLMKPVGQSHLFDAISEAVRKNSATAAPEPAPTTEGGAAAGTAEGTGYHVLVAEDNEINQMVAAAILRHAGYTCDIVENGIQAVEAAKTGRYDLVLMDCQMPEMDGFDAAREIRRGEAASHTPAERRLAIVALTANAIKGDREQCLAAGMDDYVSKPIDQGTLYATMRAVLAGRERRQAAAEGAGSPQVAPADAADAACGSCGSGCAGGSCTGTCGEAKSCGEGSPGATVEAAATTPPPLNLGELCTRCMNNTEFTAKILRKFQDRMAEDMAALTRTVADRKLEEASRIAHSLKGSAANLAAPAVRSVAAEIEALSRAGDAALVEGALAQLRTEVDRCLAYIPEAIAGLTPATSAPSGTART